uniref:Large envelope protein n=17 Tax=Hepatitis B virus TaxID=10407 RepID=G1E7V7_HBV|nr:truncated polymerase [Hepatitis B virus]
MPLSYQHFRRLLLLDDEAGPLEEELPRLADEGLNRRVAEDLNLGNLNVSIPWTHKVGNFTGLYSSTVPVFNPHWKTPSFPNIHLHQDIIKKCEQFVGPLTVNEKRRLQLIMPARFYPNVTKYLPLDKGIKPYYPEHLVNHYFQTRHYLHTLWKAGILYKRETTHSASFCGSSYSWEQELQHGAESFHQQSSGILSRPPVGSSLQSKHRKSRLGLQSQQGHLARRQQCRSWSIRAGIHPTSRRPFGVEPSSTTFHQTLQDPRVRGLYFPAGGSSSGTVNPVPTTVSHISSISSRIGDPALNMENITSGFLGPLLVLQAGFFLLTRILTIPQSLDSWWTSLNFLGGTTVCLGQNSQSPTSNHSPTSCPPTCPGYRWMCLRRFIIFLFILLLCLIFLLVLLDYQGMLPVCPLIPGSSTTSTGPCRTCTTPAQGTSMYPSCCCTKPSDGNCTCIPIPSSWAFGKFLWEWASARFSWLSLLVPFVQWFVGLSPTVWLSVIWMMWYWGPRLYSILSPFLPLLPIFFCLWVYI